MSDRISMRASKRRRTTSPRRSTPSSSASSSSTPATSHSSPTPTCKTHPRPRLSRFLSWCRKQGLAIDPRLDLRYSGSSLSWSISCHAASDIAADEVLATIPKTAVLSRRTSALAPYLKGKWLSDDPQTVGLELALCLLYERCLGASSAFAPFIEILPRLPVSLPFLFPRDSPPALWLTGTEAERINTRAAHAHCDPSWAWDHQYGMCRAKALDYFSDVGIPLLKRTKLFDKTQKQHLEGLEEAFLRAYTVVSSRDFIVDTYHGVGLVPVADLFNHAETHTVQFESDQDVCELCGTPLITGHDEEACRFAPEEDEEDEEEEEEEEEGEEDEEEEGQDQSAQSPGRPASEAPEADPHPVAEDEDEIEVDDTLDMRTLSAHALGDEIYNTYGALPNALLLTRYGFCLDTETDFERFTFDIRFPAERNAFLSAFPPSASADRSEEVLEWLVSTFLNEADEEEAEEGEREGRGHDLVYRLDEVVGGNGWVGDTFAPLYHTSLSGDEEVDEDLIDRDHIQPLFVDATGRISRVLFALTHLLLHDHAKNPSELLSSVTPQDELVQASLRTLQTLLSTRREGLHLTHHLEHGLELLQDSSGEEYITKATIQHAYQEHAALTSALASLSDLLG